MRLLKELDQKDLVEIGRGLHDFASDLYPICRSITGDGIRQTLAMIKKRIPLQVFDVPTGTEVFDWTIPQEWNIADAYRSS
jgi:aminopeptidase-like protein